MSYCQLLFTRPLVACYVIVYLTLLCNCIVQVCAGRAGEAWIQGLGGIRVPPDRLHTGWTTVDNKLGLQTIAYGNTHSNSTIC